MIISYLIATAKGIWPFVILGIVVFGIIFYVIETMVLSFGIAKPHKRHMHTKIKKSKVSKEFKKIYHYIETNYAKEVEKNRKTLLKSIIICLVLFIISFSLLLFLRQTLDIKSKNGYGILGLLFIPLVIYYTYKYKKYNTAYLQVFKSKIIHNFVNYINPNLYYHQYGGKHLLHYYLDAKFKGHPFSRFVTDDYIEGYLDNSTNIEMCNISLENVNENGELLNLVYEGIFSVTQLDIYLSDEIRIEKNKYSLKLDCNKVEMDNNEFEKYFDVYSHSNILAMQVLTHDVMEELVQFYNTYKIKFEIIMKNHNIYIRFDTGVMFEPNILKSSNDQNTLWIYYNILQFVTNVTIKINTLLKNLEI